MRGKSGLCDRLKIQAEPTVCESALCRWDTSPANIAHLPAVLAPSARLQFHGDNIPERAFWAAVRRHLSQLVRGGCRAYLAAPKVTVTWRNPSECSMLVSMLVVFFFA